VPLIFNNYLSALSFDSFLFIFLSNSLRFLSALWVSAVNKTQALLSLTLYLDK